VKRHARLQGSRTIVEHLFQIVRGVRVRQHSALRETPRCALVIGPAICNER
jgi:hypothetical protein